MLAVAFKEWAVVCRALAEGRQSLILRKGGIAEMGGEFRPEYDRFWLYPTHFHEQQQKGIKAASLPLLDAAEAARTEPGTIPFSHFVEVAGVYHVTELERALALDAYHIWSADTVRQRFHYRSPGLYVLAVRVFRAGVPAVLPEHPSYAGCKTWVELEPGAEEQPAVPVLTDAEWVSRRTEIQAALNL
ncbi:DUF1802 family protein [Fimbriiglobus ruber]|uniref:DUF1802 family protein n=1 Tax=Fimbriiglobus ruber TaxID=1908690 RepID=A0A225E0V8_9BACT|nr:DUF1802 family protein [Fimbriiglobus ruber]OWK47221.1 hypothetical protein FRUB_00920 [Fimbriiglobus ruber]